MRQWLRDNWRKEATMQQDELVGAKRVVCRQRPPDGTVGLGDGKQPIILLGGSVTAEFCPAHRPVFRTSDIPWEAYVQAFVAAGPCQECVTGWTGHWTNSV